MKKYVIENDYGMMVISARSIRSAEKIGREEEGTEHFRGARLATDTDIAWYESMSGCKVED